MQQIETQLLLSASDLAGFLACRHLASLDQRAALGQIERPARYGPRLQGLIERGLQHEREYVADLRARGLQVVELNQEYKRPDPDETLGIMRSGADAIVQAGLASGRWQGLADVLLRVPRRSTLGDWSYEVVDTKLAQETRAGTVLQLSLYSDLLAGLQGVVPREMHVIKPGDPFARESFRVADFQAYYRLVAGQLVAAVEGGPADDTYPYPVDHCQVCRWWRDCTDRRHADDHLSLIAGVRTLQVQELERRGIVTLEQFATRTAPLDAPPARGSIESYEAAHDQARVQLEGRRRGAPFWKFLPVEPGRGFCRLPAPSAGDIFLDFEGDPHVPGGGLEYLTGYAWVDDGQQRYQASWATGPLEERAAYETFIDFVRARLRTFPDLHVYHYAPYEPTALKRLMGRYASREGEMDELLRSERLVDLHRVARQALRASVERYSLKDLEVFAGFTRGQDLREASASMRRVEHALEFGRPDALDPEDRERVTAYNRDDCLATRALRDWLERQRSACQQARGDAIPRPDIPDGQASDAVAERAEDVQRVYARLVADLPPDPEVRSPAERGRWLLAHLLEYFRREDRCAWWEFFRLCELDDDALLEERKGISGLVFEARDGGRDTYPIHRYRFPPQEISLDVGDGLYESADLRIGAISRIDPVAGLVWIKKSRAAAGTHPSRVVVNERVAPGPLPEALLCVADDIAERGMEATRYAAARDLLLQRPPRGAAGGVGAALRRPDEQPLAAAERIALGLDGGVLAVQGPPGSGKTFVGAGTIVRLVRAGRRVGVTAVSHKAILHLLRKVREAAREVEVPLTVRHKHGRHATDEDEISGPMTSEEIESLLARGGVVGATVWQWARAEAEATLDYLFVDEAGQMSLAMVLAASRATRNLVLLGDPQQLEQPQRGAHPEGAEVAALQHLLAGRAVMPADRGLFLDQTWRLSPDICLYTSELFYEGCLHAAPDRQLQEIVGPSPFAGSGLYHVPAAHVGNQNPAPEEVEIVGRLVEHLAGGDLAWIDPARVRRPLGLDDILIVAPYNAQVRALTARLPDARIGTVDRFQGLEAAVVIYSMTSSSAEDAPRGLGFLYDRHRLNVATSRARCAVILVATDRLFAPECRAPEQMRLANALCRYREMATRVADF